MLILAIDTSGRTCSCALLEENGTLTERTLNEGLTHSEALMPLIDSVLTEAGRDISDVDIIAAAAGPGSFTGIRIGVCAAKGLAQTLDKPIAAIDTLELLKENAAGFEGSVCAMLDARHGQVYCAIFEKGKRLTADMAVSAGEAAELCRDGAALFVGDGALAYRELISEVLPGAIFTEDNFPHAAHAARLAMGCTLTDAKGISPIYLRESQAERKKHERMG